MRTRKVVPAPLVVCGNCGHDQFWWLVKVYRLSIFPSEGEPEGEDRDEYFPSARAARVRRRTIIDDGEARDGELEIECIEVSDTLPRLSLILALLNRVGYAGRRIQIVPPYQKRRARNPRTPS